MQAKLNWVQATLPSSSSKFEEEKLTLIPIFYVKINHRTMARVELDWDTHKQQFKNKWLIQIMGFYTPDVEGIMQDAEKVKLIAEQRLQELSNEINILLS